MQSNTFKTTAIWICLTMLFIFAVSCTSPNSVVNSAQKTQIICSNKWYQSIEEVVTTGDGHGHGPDVGSDEWKSVIEFKLGIQGLSTVPQRDSETWCPYIDHLVQTESSFNN